MNNNQRTLASYEAKVAAYIHQTPTHPSPLLQAWLKGVLSGLSPESRLFEIGSASGRDATYIESLGYAVQRTDAARNFVEVMRHTGQSAEFFNVLTDPFPGTYDGIFAIAVLLHFTRTEMNEVIIPKAYAALNPGGRFAFAIIEGDGETWSNGKIDAPRYFCYWQEADIIRALTENGFSKATVTKAQLENQTKIWLYVTAYK